MSQTVNASATSSGAAYFLCERLDCYRVAVEFQGLASAWCGRARLGALRGQLERASVSIVLNIAEGAGRHAAGDKARFFTIARGSAAECGAILELLAARGIVTSEEHRHGREKLIRVAQMLTRLITRQLQD